MNQTIDDLETQLAECDDDRERARILHELGGAVRFIDPGRARMLAQESMDCARAHGDRAMEANACMLHGAVSLPMSDFESARRSLDRAIAIAEELGDELLRTKALSRMVSYHHWIGDPAAAIALAKQCIPVLERHKEYAVLVGVLLITAGSYGQREEYRAVFEVLFRAAGICEANGFEKELATVYSTIASVSASIGDNRNALGYVERSMAISRKLGDLFGEGVCRLLSGNCYVQLREPHNAVGHLTEAMRIFRELGFGKLEVDALAALGVALLDQGKKSEALECFTASVAVLQELEGGSFLGYSLHHIALVLFDRKEYELAEQYLTRALNRAEESDDRRLRCGVYEVMAGLYENRGMLDRALECYKRYAETRIEGMEVDTRIKIAGMEAQFQAQLLEKERALQDLEIERLRGEMEHRNRELTVRALQLVEKSEHVRKVREQLRELRAVDRESLDAALRRMESELGSENDWERFSQQFMRVHAGFIERLAQRCPGLTQTEVRICALARADLSIKEMASLLSIEGRSVEVYRNRVRRKLGLTRKDSFNGFMMGI